MEAPNEDMMVISAECRQCNKPILIALMGNDVGDLFCGPEDFSKEEQLLAEKHGVYLKLVNSKTAEETYLANACKECGAFVGKFYFFAHYYTAALFGHYKYERVKYERVG